MDKERVPLAIRLACELGPVALLHAGNFAYGVAFGTWTLIVSTLAASVVLMWLARRLPVFPFLVLAFSLAFGTVTLLTGDPTWIYLKTGIGNFAVPALGALIVLREWRRE